MNYSKDVFEVVSYNDALWGRAIKCLIVIMIAFFVYAIINIICISIFKNKNDDNKNKYKKGIKNGLIGGIIFAIVMLVAYLLAPMIN